MIDLNINVILKKISGLFEDEEKSYSLHDMQISWDDNFLTIENNRVSFKVDLKDGWTTFKENGKEEGALFLPYGTALKDIKGVHTC